MEQNLSKFTEILVKTMKPKYFLTLAFALTALWSNAQIIPYQRITPPVKRNTVGMYPELKNKTSWDGREPGSYSIKFKCKALKPGQMVFLADHHIGGKYLRDTAEIQANGIATFNGSYNTKKPSPSKLQRGMYLFVLPEKRDYFEFMIDDDQDFTITFDTSFYEREYYKKMKVDGSTENSDFVQYQVSKMSVIEKLIALDEEVKKDSTPANIKRLEPKKAAYLREKEASDSLFVATHPKNLLSHFIYSLIAVDFPTVLPTKADGTKDSAYPFNYFKLHYWDHVDFNEDGLVRMPVNVLKQKLDFYFDKVIVPDADTCIVASEWLLAKTKNSIENEKYIIWYLTNRFESSNVMGLDKAFVHMALSNYCAGKAWWVDSVTVAKMCENAFRRSHTLIGQIAPELELKNLDSAWVRTNLIRAPYTIMIFWDPTCGHCKEVLPKLAKIYEENKSKGWKVVALSSGDKKKEWHEYAKEHPEMKEFIHLIRGEVQSQKYADALYSYYVIASPTIFILDSNKKIIANRIDVEKVAEFIEHSEKFKTK